ncbi:Hsp33 family molecular chaperone HslO [Lagierella sp.]|uniref:Hsp33 family molecular chaperone HslO n=1 Tax=Lagierella sp. TaxID=2849657 RepID=UPI0026189533|nr:Hsp33 family molecular chaperone HslO [Lagierella sp.]
MVKLYRYINEKETLSFFIINSTDLVEEMRKIHNTSTTATAALGRLSTMAALMGSEIKNDKEKIILKIKGDGPAGLLISEINKNGDIRSFIQNPHIDIPSVPNKPKLDVGGFVGHNGNLVVIRDFGFGEPYSGHTELVSGEIAEDFAKYFYTSHQLPTVVSLGVLVDVDYSVKSAGGLFIQALPNCSEEDLNKLEESLKEFPPISSLFVDYDNPEKVINKYFSDFKPKLLGIDNRQYKCSCNRDKIEKLIVSLGEKETSEILQEEGQIEIKCSYCNEKYVFSKEEVDNIFDKRN